jgi:hypothetical protein
MEPGFSQGDTALPVAPIGNPEVDRGGLNEGVTLE